MNKRRSFSREYKLAAVKKVVEKGLTVTEVARDLGIRDTLIHNWKRAFEADGTIAQEVHGSATLGILWTIQSATKTRLARTVHKKSDTFDNLSLWSSRYRLPAMDYNVSKIMAYSTGC